MRCSACDHPDVVAIETALAVGTSGREVARAFGLGRNVIARHVAHTAEARSGPKGRRDHLAEALALLDRAAGETDRLRALEGARSALALELKDHRRSRAAVKAPDGSQMARLRQNLDEAWEHFEAVKASRPGAAARALQGVRQALDQLRQAQARIPDDPLRVTLVMADGTQVAEWTSSSEGEREHHGVPTEFWTEDHAVDVAMTLEGTPTVTLMDLRTERVVWRSGSTRPFRPAPSEGSGNGHKREKGERNG